MEEERKQYFYQPDMTTAIINWCWVLLILVVGIIIAFEYTYFQWVTATFIGVFLILRACRFFGGRWWLPRPNWSFRGSCRGNL